jgi:predicted MFS family arabinose efflux permease
MASWAPMVPFARSRLGLDEAALGLVLLALGGGAMVTMPVSGVLIHRIGSRRVILLALVVVVAALPALALAPTPGWLAAALCIFGSGIGAMDVAMNAQAVAVEARLGRPVMSSFHGLFSVGGLVGALGLSLLLERGLALTPAVVAVAVFCAVAAGGQIARLLPPDAEIRPAQARWAFPGGVVLALGAFCFLAFLAEGALLDWSAVFLTVERGMKETSAGIGYAVFSLAMAVGRLTGDAVAARLGPVRTVRLGAFLAAAGYLLAVTVPDARVTVVAFGLTGLGLANVVPLLFSAAGRRGDPAVALPVITTMGYAGLLAGPAVLGAVGQAAGLGWALGGVGATLIGIGLCARIAGAHAVPLAESGRAR